MQQTLLQHHGDNPTVTAPRVLLGQDAVRALRSILKGWRKEGSAGAPCSSTNTCCGLGGSLCPHQLHREGEQLF